MFSIVQDGYMHKHLKIGWIGLGVMGAAMCQHVQAAGHHVSVYTRSREKALPLLEQGAAWCDSAKALAESADIIVTTVGTELEVRDVYFSELGILSADIAGKLVIDMGTTAPALALEIAERCAAHGADFVDAPVSGGDVGARNATLSIMAGGSATSVNAAAPVFSLLGRYTHTGATASGQHSKMCNQIVVAGTMIGVCEALVYAANAELDLEALINTIRTGAAGCWTLDNLAPRISRNDYAPGFMVDHFIKDLGIAVREAEAMKLELPGLALAKQLYEKVSRIGHGRSGTQALVLALQILDE
jgi:3-hydroxyisobutyrate dehydrogenase